MRVGDQDIRYVVWGHTGFREACHQCAVGRRAQTRVDQDDAVPGTHQQRIHAERDSVVRQFVLLQQLADGGGARIDTEDFGIVVHDVLRVVQSDNLQRADLESLGSGRDRLRTEAVIGRGRGREARRNGEQSCPGPGVSFANAHGDDS